MKLKKFVLTSMFVSTFYLVFKLSDMDECLINNGNCGGGNVTRASCTNSPGSYKCECNEGFVIPPTCKSNRLYVEK